MLKARKRPCTSCRQWFRHDPGVGERQRACDRPECQTARRRKTQASESTKNRGLSDMRSSESMAIFAHPKGAVAKTPMFLSRQKRVQPSFGSYNQQVMLSVIKT